MTLLNQADAQTLMKFVLDHLADHPIKTAESFRNAVLHGSLAVNPLLGMELDAVKPIQQMIVNAVTEGRMIDFGFIPNEVIKLESKRCRQMFEDGEFDYPYETWLGVSRWEGGMNGYLFITDQEFPGKVVSVELYGVAVPEVHDVILIYDMITISVSADGSRVTPILFKNVKQTEDQLKARGANSHDPLVTMLRLLADASVPVIDHPAPERLNRARVRQGKAPIPPHIEVVTREYVAAFQRPSTAAGRESKGGHHASPVAHWRRAHRRHLASGKVIPVRSSKVNWRDPEEMRRLFYRIEERSLGKG